MQTFRQWNKDRPRHHLWGDVKGKFIEPNWREDFDHPINSEMFTGFYYFKKPDDMEPDRDSPIFEGDILDFYLFIYDDAIKAVRLKLRDVTVSFKDGGFWIGETGVRLSKHSYHRWIKKGEPRL